MAIDQSTQLAMLEEKVRLDTLLAQSESKKLFALENDSSVRLNKWRQSAGQIAEHHEFIVCPRNASGIIVGKGFKHVKAINTKVISSLHFFFPSVIHYLDKLFN